MEDVEAEEVRREIAGPAAFEVCQVTSLYALAEEGDPSVLQDMLVRIWVSHCRGLETRQQMVDVLVAQLKDLLSREKDSLSPAHKDSVEPATRAISFSVVRPSSKTVSKKSSLTSPKPSADPDKAKEPDKKSEAKAAEFTGKIIDSGKQRLLDVSSMIMKNLKTSSYFGLGSSGSSPDSGSHTSPSPTPASVTLPGLKKSTKAVASFFSLRGPSADRKKDKGEKDRPSFLEKDKHSFFERDKPSVYEKDKGSVYEKESVHEKEKDGSVYEKESISIPSKEALSKSGPSDMSSLSKGVPADLSSLLKSSSFEDDSDMDLKAISVRRLSSPIITREDFRIDVFRRKLMDCLEAEVSNNFAFLSKKFECELPEAEDTVLNLSPTPDEKKASSQSDDDEGGDLEEDPEIRFVPKKVHLKDFRSLNLKDDDIDFEQKTFMQVQEQARVALSDFGIGRFVLSDYFKTLVPKFSRTQRQMLLDSFQNKIPLPELPVSSLGFKIWAQVFSFLDRYTVFGILRQVCRLFLRVIQSKHFWNSIHSFEFLKQWFPSVDDDLPALLSRLHHVKNLSVYSSTAIENLLNLISQDCPNVLSLNLRDAGSFSMISLQKLFVTCNKILRLDLSGCISVDDATVMKVCSLENLISLNISNCGLLSNKIFPDLIAVKGLQHLFLATDRESYDLLTDEGFILLTEIKSLRTLDISRRRISSETLVAISTSCSRLEVLVTAGIDAWTDLSFASASKNFTEVLTLDLSGCVKLTNSALIDISSFCLKLRSLNLSLCNLIDDYGFLSVCNNCNFIESLNISSCRLITDAVLAVIPKSFPGLKNLAIHLINDEIALQITKELPNLISLKVNQAHNLTDGAFKSLMEGLNVLEVLEMKRASKIRGDCFKSLFRYRIRSTLRSLSFSEAVRIDETAVTSIAQVPAKLLLLDASGCPQLSESCFLVLLASPFRLTLRSIILAGCIEVTDEIIHTICLCVPYLEHLDVSDCLKISDRSSPYLNTAYRLRSLNISGTSITSAGFVSLQDHLFKHLRILEIRGCGYPVSQIANIQKKFEVLRIYK